MKQKILSITTASLLMIGLTSQASFAQNLNVETQNPREVFDIDISNINPNTLPAEIQFERIDSLNAGTLEVLFIYEQEKYDVRLTGKNNNFLLSTSPGPRIILDGVDVSSYGIFEILEEDTHPLEKFRLRELSPNTTDKYELVVIPTFFIEDNVVELTDKKNVISNEGTGAMFLFSELTIREHENASNSDLHVISNGDIVENVERWNASFSSPAIGHFWHETEPYPGHLRIESGTVTAQAGSNSPAIGQVTRGYDNLQVTISQNATVTAIAKDQPAIESTEWNHGDARLITAELMNPSHLETTREMRIYPGVNLAGNSSITLPPGYKHVAFTTQTNSMLRMFNNSGEPFSTLGHGNPLMPSPIFVTTTELSPVHAVEVP